MNKKIFSKILFGFLFCMCMLFIPKDNVQASIYLDMENTTITEENAVVSVMSYSHDIPISAITIVVKKDGEEIKRLVTEVNTHESKRYTYDFRKDLGIALEKDSLYEYTVIQDFEFYEDTYAVGQFYTGSDCYVTVYMVRWADANSVFRSECIIGLNAGNSFHYAAQETYAQGNRMNYMVEVFSSDKETVYEIECLSENSKENEVWIKYKDDIDLGGGRDFGGVYLKDSATEQVLDDYVMFTCSNSWEDVYIPSDIIKIKEQYYMYDAKRTGKTYVMCPSKPFYENIFDIYYKKCEFPTTQTSATVNFVNAETGKRLYQKTVSNLTVGEAFTYTPENTYANSENSYVYVWDFANNVLTIDKLWTNPENNVLTVYYKVDSSESEQPKKVVNPLKKEKPVIKKANRKSKTTAKIKFSKVKKVTGYEICYSTKKSFKKSVTKRVKKTTITLKNLKKKKTYYVKVRGYRIMDGEVFYSKYSKVKRI